MKALFAIVTVAGAGALYAWSVQQSKQIQRFYRDW